MAVIPWGVVTTPVDGQAMKLVRWVNLTDGDTAVPYVVGAYSDKSVQFVGNGGSGITIQGSLDTDPATADWETLNDPQGNPLLATTDKIENILEHCYQLRPSIGASVSGATVWLLLASTR